MSLFALASRDRHSWSAESARATRRKEARDRLPANISPQSLSRDEDQALGHLLVCSLPRVPVPDAFLHGGTEQEGFAAFRALKRSPTRPRTRRPTFRLIPRRQFPSGVRLVLQ